MNSFLLTWMQVVSVLIILFVTCRDVVLTDEKLVLVIDRIPTNSGVTGNLLEWGSRKRHYYGGASQVHRPSDSSIFIRWSMPLT